MRRVLADDGVLWLVIGDSYNAHSGNRKKTETGLGGVDHAVMYPSGYGLTDQGLGVKNLIGIPWRVAFALQDDGWILRNAIIWNKPNAMPESVSDRLSNRYEHLFLFSKQRRYKFNLDAIREPLKYPERTGHVFGGTKYIGVNADGRSTYDPGRTVPGGTAQSLGPTGKRHHGSPRGKNPGDVWSISTSPYSGAHFATFPSELVRRCLLAGSDEGDTVLDPFAGAGTTLMVARELGRDSVGIELNREYALLARERILVRDKP